MGAAVRQECPEGQGRALDEEERRELLRLQEPPRRGQGAQADPQMGCNRRGRARQSEARRSARSLQHWQRGVSGQRLPLGADRGEPEGEGLAEPYPPARRTKSSAVGAPEVGEHDALEGARPCRARIRPAAELDGRQDCAHHWHRAGEVQDRNDEPQLQHPPAGSARADGSCTRLSALTGGLRVASCKGPRGRRPGVKTVPDRGLTSAQALQPLAQLRQKSPKASIVRGSLKAIRPEILVEGEIGDIGSGSEIHDTAPDLCKGLTTPAQARQFVQETRIDTLAPAVGNMHGMLKSMVAGDTKKRLDIERIRTIKEQTRVFMTLHGASGTD